MRKQIAEEAARKKKEAEKNGETTPSDFNKDDKDPATKPDTPSTPAKTTSYTKLVGECRAVDGAYNKGIRNMILPSYE